MNGPALSLYFLSLDAVDKHFIFIFHISFVGYNANADMVLHL